MNSTDTLKLAFQNLWRMRFRTILTIFGVIIGISAIVLFVSLGVGLQKITSDQIASMNSLTTITVTQTPATSSMEAGPAVNDEAVKKIKALENIKSISPSVSMPANVTALESSAGAIINGIQFDNIKSEVPVISCGREAKSDSEAIISSMLANSFSSDKESVLDKEIKVAIVSKEGDSLEYKLSDVKLTIVGIDNNETTNIVYAPLSKIYSAGKFSSYSSLKVIAESRKNVDPIQKEIKTLGYTTTTIKDLIDQIDKIFLIVQIILGIVGGIGLLVSSFGIINTMTISLLERTREIGIMKAIGASNKDIKKMFYFESALIGLFGGVAGIALAIAVGELSNYSINMLIRESGQELNLFITPIRFTVCMLLFAVIISLVACVYPANRAKKISPMTALRQ